jgi:hypothetical protein
MKLCAPSLLALAVAQDPDQPHLAQAWQAMSTGDGLPGEIGLESYLFLEKNNEFFPHSFQGHVWDYGEECKKVEINSHFSKDIDYFSGTYYVNCDGVPCCYASDDGIDQPSIPDVKGWDIAKAGLTTKVGFGGYHDITELNDNPVKGAESWWEKHRLMLVNYTYFLHREETGDIITHRIEYEAPTVAPGAILYGDFKAQHNISEFLEAFKAPPGCWNTFSCGDDRIARVEKKRFKHSAFLRQLKASQAVTV